MPNGNAYPAIQLDAEGHPVDSGVVIQFTNATFQPPVPGGDDKFAEILLSGAAFTNVTKPTISDASAAAIIAALVTLGLVIDDT